MSTETPECQICCEEFTKQQRKKVICPQCDYECCSQCIKNYILGQSAEPHCMNCIKPLSRNFLKEYLGITFIRTTYKDKKKELLYEVEKSKLPTSMEAAKRYKKSLRLKDKLKDLIEERNNIRERERLIQLDISRMNDRIWSLENGHSDQGENDVKKRQEFTHPCVDENCNGFMSSQWKCGICKKFACPHCHEIIGMRKDEPHICDEDTVKTVAAIKKDTKPCPKCHSPIFKISGCDQMWCTQCEVAFSWKTGNIQIGMIHNPHFYEARRKLGINTRNPGDVVCGGLVGAWEFRYSFQKHCSSSVFRHYVSIQPQMRIADVLFHLIYVIVHRSTSHNIHILDLLRREVRDLESTEKLRVLYLVGEKSEETFKKDIYRNNETLSKKRRLCDIFETYINIMIENVNAISNDAGTTSSLNEIFKKIMARFIECEKIKKYTECEFLKIGCEYRQATYIFSDTNYELTYKRIPNLNKKKGASQNWNAIEKLIEETERKEYTKEYMVELFNKSVISKHIADYNDIYGNVPKPLREFTKYITDDIIIEQEGGGGGGGGAAAGR